MITEWEKFRIAATAFCLGIYAVGASLGFLYGILCDSGKKEKYAGIAASVVILITVALLFFGIYFVISYFYG